MRFYFETFPNRYIDIIYVETPDSQKILNLLRQGKLNAGFINPKLVCKNSFLCLISFVVLTISQICDWFQILVAAVASLQAESSGSLSTHNLYSEVVHRYFPPF